MHSAPTHALHLFLLPLPTHFLGAPRHSKAQPRLPLSIPTFVYGKQRIQIHGGGSAWDAIHFSVNGPQPKASNCSHRHHSSLHTYTQTSTLTSHIAPSPPALASSRGGPSMDPVPAPAHACSQQPPRNNNSRGPPSHHVFNSTWVGRSQAQPTHKLDTLDDTSTSTGTDATEPTRGPHLHPTTLGTPILTLPPPKCEHYPCCFAYH